MSKILLISHIFPPAIDGGSRVIYKIGQYFQSTGDEILYLSSNCSSTDDFTKQTKTPCPVKGRVEEGFYLPVYHHLRRPLKLINLFLPSKSYLHQLLQVFQKGPILKFFPFIKATIQILKFKPDLIIAGPLPTTTILYANFFKKIINLKDFRPFLRENAGLPGRGFCKLLINASFHPTDQDFHRKPLIKTLQSADYLWTLTQYETDYFIKNFHIDPNKVILAGNGVDESFLKKSTKIQRTRVLVHQSTKILFIGSLSAHKGLDILIDSFSKLMSSNPEYQSTSKLIIAGQKTLHYPQIKKQISALPKDIQSKIKFIFNFPQNQLINIIDNCDLLVLPSSQESFGLCLIEALARKKPIITSNIPQLSEIVTKSRGGLIFELNNPNDLSQKILKLIKNPQLTYQLSQKGFNYVKNNYTWTTVGNKIKKKIELV